MSARTPEERERARLEREARRAARRGEPPVAEPPVGEPPVAEPLSAEPPLPLTEDTRLVEPPEDRPLTPPPAVPRRAPRDPAATRAAAARVASRVRRKREQSGGPPVSPPPRRERRSRGERGPRSTLFRVVVALAVLAALVIAWFLFSLFQPLKGDGEGTVRVRIPTGATVSQIGATLEQSEVISSEFFFRARVTLGGSRGDLKPGSYRLKRDMSYGAAIDALSEGPPKDIVTVTIPEGHSRAEIAPIVEGAGLDGSYRRATVRSAAFDLRRYRAGAAKTLEGFLFPATYELKRNASAADLVAKQLEAFETNFAKVDLRRARSKNLTPYDVLVIASMVEREAGVAKDRPLIASVIYNRLKAGMPLGIDATLRFALGNWTRPLRQSELASTTPYNTRKFTGLPPGPIGNPGLDSIQAAANPAQTDYLFFVVRPCGEGEHKFSETNEEFLRDAAEYEAERQRQGRSPTDC